MNVADNIAVAPQVLKKMILDAAGTASVDGRKVVDLLVAFALEQVGQPGGSEGEGGRGVRVGLYGDRFHFNIVMGWLYRS